MDILKVLGELQQERDQIDETILSLERLSLRNGNRRGRPPAWVAAAKKARPKETRSADRLKE
jgi:hypothetical protein